MFSMHNCARHRPIEQERRGVAPSNRHFIPVSALGLFVVFIAGLWPWVAQASLPNWASRNWETIDGLPDNDITGIAQTEEGYLWVATKGGLMRFNGVEFKPFPVLQMPQVPSRAVRVMHHDRAGRLWLAMERGPLLCVETNRVSSFGVDDGLLLQRVIDLADDGDGGLWVVYGSALRRIQNGLVEQVELAAVSVDSPNSLITSDSSGKIWLARGSYLLSQVDGQLQVVRRFDRPLTALGARGKSGLWVVAGGRLISFSVETGTQDFGSIPPRAVPSVLYEDKSGMLWMGTMGSGLFCWKDGLFEDVETSHNEITCMTEDAEGNLWVGTTGGGLNSVRPRAVTLLGLSDKLPFDSLQSVCQDSAGRLWVVSGGGELAVNENDLWQVIDTTQRRINARVNCVASDGSGGVWVGTSGAGLKRLKGDSTVSWRQREGLPSDVVRSLLVARDDTTWVATASPDRLVKIREGKITILDRPGNLGPIRAITEDAAGRVWIGTAEGKLFRAEGNRLVAEPSIPQEFTLSIRTIHATADGALWIGYAGDGLGRFKDGKYVRLTTAHGLADDFISQLLSDDKGGLWLLGNRGLSRVQISDVDAVLEGRAEQIRTRIYGKNDGLPAIQPRRDYSPAACRTATGQLYFTTRSGLLTVIPEHVLDNPTPPPVLLEEVRVDDETIAAYGNYPPVKLHGKKEIIDLRGFSDSLRLSPDHQKVEFDFAGLSYVSPESVQFRYKLEGFDQKWTEAGRNHLATYPRLRSGRYAFQIIACNNAGVWNERGDRVVIEVPPFFWEMWWFRLAISLTVISLAGGAVFLIARRRYHRKLQQLEARRALEQERSRIAKDIHDDLGASLTQITLLSQTAVLAEDPQGVMDSLRQINATARELTQAMGEVVWAVNPEHDSLDGMANYLSSYSHSFLSLAGIRCRLELPLALPKHSLSAEARHNLFLAFKEALNNVIKHSRATEVRIALRVEGGRCLLSVSDNGRGLDAKSNTNSGLASGNGLANMRSRLRDIGGTCEVTAESPKGTRVTFCMSLDSRK